MNKEIDSYIVYSKDEKIIIKININTLLYVLIVIKVNINIKTE